MLHFGTKSETENFRNLNLFVTDHDFQTALTEALCRVLPPDQRKEVADRLFHMEHVAGAFVKLRDSEFETVTFFPNASSRSKLTFHCTVHHISITFQSFNQYL